MRPGTKVNHGEPCMSLGELGHWLRVINLDSGWVKDKEKHNLAFILKESLQLLR